MKHKTAVRWTLVASLFVAGSCAPASQGHLAAPGTPYDTKEAEQTLTFGYRSIVERHLEQISAADVAVEGMRGLASLDPAVDVTRTGDKVQLTSAEHVVADYPAPPKDDVDAWARLTVTVALDARGFSAPIREAALEKVYEAVFDAALARLDRFSRYAGKAEAREHRANRNGFGGIGIRFEITDDQIRLTAVMDDTPASRAGLQVGDVLLRIGNDATDGMAREDISRHLRGSVGSDVTLVVRRGSAAPTPVSLQRTLIVPQTVTASIHDGFAEFRISSFNQRTAINLTAALKNARAQLGSAIKGVVLDLRGNPGGLLDQAVQVSDLFMAEGPIVTTRGRHPLASQSYEARPGDIGEDLPVVVLVDSGSASAAEIVTGALEDSGRAVVVGTNSYGKGTVQTVIRLPNDGEMTLTWSRFYTPSGYALHGLGVLPTLCTATPSASPAAVMDGLTRVSTDPAPVTLSLARWRTVALDDTGTRHQLRSLCPGVKHGESETDLRLAERLLSDAPAFAHALAMSAPAGLAASATASAHRPAVTQQVQQ